MNHTQYELNYYIFRDYSQPGSSYNPTSVWPAVWDDTESKARLLIGGAIDGVPNGKLFNNYTTGATYFPYSNFGINWKWLIDFNTSAINPNNVDYNLLPSPPAYDSLIGNGVTWSGNKLSSSITSFHDPYGIPLITVSDIDTTPPYDNLTWEGTEWYLKVSSQSTRIVLDVIEDPGMSYYGMGYYYNNIICGGSIITMSVSINQRSDFNKKIF